MKKKIKECKNTSEEEEEKIYISVIGTRGVGKTYFCKIFKDNKVENKYLMPTIDMNIYSDKDFNIKLIDTSGDLAQFNYLSSSEIFSTCQLFVYIFRSDFPETYFLGVIKQYIDKIKEIKDKFYKKKKIKTKQE